MLVNFIIKIFKKFIYQPHQHTYENRTDVASYGIGGTMFQTAVLVSTCKTCGKVTSAYIRGSDD